MKEHTFEEPKTDKLGGAEGIPRIPQGVASQVLALLDPSTSLNQGKLPI